jgi:nitrogen fixation NifU-like protein
MKTTLQYSKKVMKHFLKPKFAGVIKDADAVGEIINDKCGDVMKIYLKVTDNKIKDIKFQTLGCPAALAASDVLCQLVKGKTLKQAEKVNEKIITEKLGGLPAVKVHCSVLGARTLKDAIEKYRKKKKEKR